MICELDMAQRSSESVCLSLLQYLHDVHAAHLMTQGAAVVTCPITSDTATTSVDSNILLIVG